MSQVIITFSKYIKPHNYCPTLQDNLNLLEDEGYHFAIGDELGIGWLAKNGNGYLLDGTAWATEAYINCLHNKFKATFEESTYDTIYNALNKLLNAEWSIAILNYEEN